MTKTRNLSDLLDANGDVKSGALDNASSTTINNNANNRLITGSATADTLEAESNITFDGTNLDLLDSKKIRLGTGNDLEIYHDGSNSYIDDAGTGRIYIRGNDRVQIQKYTGEDMITANADGAVNLYHNNSKKLETVSGGVTVTGTATATTFSGSGASLTSLPAANLTGTLPAIDGSALTNLPGGGKILQVKSATDTTNRSTNSTSFTNNSSTLSISITPSSTSSKILIMMSISSYEKAGGAHFITVYRGSTNLANNDGFIPNSDSNDNKSSAVVHLDSPNTTSATTYQFRHRSESSGDSQSINGRGGTSNLILMEVGA